MIVEFVFSLYSLLFGLALAQVFVGLGNTLQERHRIKIGLLTPLLGLFVTIDITSFWAIGWDIRGVFRPEFLYLLCGVLLAGIYYLAAGLVFPRNFVEWPDFDVKYFRHKQWVFGGILFCNLVAAVAPVALGSRFRRSPPGLSNLATYFIPIIALLAVRNKRANIAADPFVGQICHFPELAVLGVGTHSELFFGAL